MSPPRSLMRGIQLSLASLTIISLQPWGFSPKWEPSWLHPTSSSAFFLYFPSQHFIYYIFFFHSEFRLEMPFSFVILFIIYFFFLLARSILIARCADLGRAGRGCGGLGCPLSALLLVAQSKTSKKKPARSVTSAALKLSHSSPLITPCSGSPLAALRSRSILRLGDAGASVRQLP